MKGYSIKVSVFLKENIDLENLHESLAELVYFSMLDSEILKNVHLSKKRYCPYSISLLTPIENSKVYKKGHMYSFEIRTFDINVAREFKRVLPGKSFKKIICESTTSKSIYFNNKIGFLENNTVSVIIEDNKCYDLRNKGFAINRISRNAIFKYNLFTGNNVNLDYEWINDIDILSLKNTVFKYKDSYMLGHKYRLEIKDDDISQGIASIVYVLGMSEKNSLGFGNCKMISI